MKVCKIWIFDVGRGFASAIKTPAGKWISIDLGTSEEFNPISDFTLPHLRKGHHNKNNGKYSISQQIITHPHNDHMTAIKDFDKNVHPGLLTVPNDIDHKAQPPKGKVNWDLITNQSDDLTKYLRNNMFPGRQPPLRATEDDTSKGFVFKIYYILPGICEEDKELSKSNYTNNISIMARLNYKGNVVLFCGDMMKDGMSKILDMRNGLSDALTKYGVNFLVAPHHGLRSSFSTDLFSAMKGNKTHGLNIIPERPTHKGSNEIVDDRYSRKEYCKGHKVIINGKSEMKRQLRTSAVGHIRLDLFEDGRSLVVAGSNALNIH